MTHNFPLGRLDPDKSPRGWTHVDRYPLLAEQVDELAERPRPVVIGVNWYSAFDDPQRHTDGRFWVARDGNLGHIRGGHCVMLKPRRAADPVSWWDWYDQVSQGICVSEGVCRAASQFNRKQYQPRPLYDECKKRDGYPGEGTWVSYGFDVLREQGAVRKTRGDRHWLTPADYAGNPRAAFDPAEGITANRWIRSIDDCLAVLGYSDKDYVDVVNSWGRSYPHLTRMPVTVLERLWREDGEIGVATDR